jgi:hypothetical protein
MADLIYADLVEETTTTTGTGALTPGGAVTGSRSFAAVLSEGDRFYYAIDGAPADASVFEVGIGTFTSGTIVREPIISSDGTSAVDLPAGTKTVSLTVAAEFYETVQAHDVFAAWQAMPGNATGTVSDFLNAMANVDGVVLDPPVLESGIFSQLVIDQQAPVSGMTNSQGGNDAVNLRLIQNGSLATNGPTSQPSYYNTVLSLGFNQTNAFAPLNTDMPSASYRIESKFAQGAPSDPFIVEFHSSMFPASDPNNEYRLFSGTVPHLVSDWDGAGADYTMRANNYRFTSGMGDDRINIRLGAVGNEVELKDNGTGKPHPWLLFGTNNRAVAQQKNAAGTSYLPLPYRNQFDNHHLGGGALYLVTPTQPTPSGDNAGFVLNLTSGVANGTAIRVYIPTITGGDFNAQFTQGSVTGKLAQVVYNTNGSAMLDLQVLNGTGSDALLGFTNNGGGGSFTIGYDNSDGDKLKIEKSYRSVGNASNLFVEFDPTINVAYFAKPPKLPSHSVTGLPNAATVGAGAMAFCTNESGGAVPVFSDGTDWRRVTDRAVVS